MKISGSLIALLSCVILGNGQSADYLLEPNCGSVNQVHSFRIVGGVPASILDNPWMALIITNTCRYGTCNLQCGGTLITRDVVLSAAHCDFRIYSTSVTLGKSDISRPSSNALTLGIADFLRHPNYRADRSNVNDIALLQLERSVGYTDFIKPVCLTNNQNILDYTSYLTATGWGLTEYKVTSNVLKVTRLRQYPIDSCSYAFGPLYKSQICAGGTDTDTCSGDSGGPITAMYDIDGTYRIVQLGIVSFGDTECTGLGVYTNVMHHFNWIWDNVRQGGYQTSSPPTRRPHYSRPNSRPHFNYFNYWY